MANDLSKIPTEQLLQMLQQHAQQPPAPQAPMNQPQPSPSQFSDTPGGAALMSHGAMGLNKHGNTMGQITHAIEQAPYQFGGWATDKAAQAGLPPEVSAGVGYAANLAPQLAMMVGGGEVANAAKAVPQAMGRWLMKKAVKPYSADLISGDAKPAIETLLKEGISPTKEGMDKVAQLVHDLHGEVEGKIAASTAEVPLGPMADKYLGQYERALTQATPDADVKAVGDVWREFSGSPLVRDQEALPVQIAHLIKQGTQRSIGSKGYGELGSVSQESQKALARYLREGVAQAEPSTVAPLKREADLMNVLEVAKNRALIEGNKDVAGLALLAHNPLAFMGMMADRSAAVKGMLARMLYSGARPAGQAAGATIGQAEGNQ